MNRTMVKVVFLKNFGCCHKKGKTFDTYEHIAQKWIEQGVAKLFEKPPENKMVEMADKAK